MDEQTVQHERWWWPGLLVAGPVVAVFAVSVIVGLGWGVPGERRKRLEGGRAPKLPEGTAGDAWRHWGSRGRKSEVGKAFPRHLFNPIRSYHPDEYQVFKSLGNMRPRRLVFDPGNYIYPSLHTYLTGAAIGVCAAVGAVDLKRDLAYYFEHPEQLGRMYVVGRALSLLAACALLVLVWRVGEGMGRGVGLLAMGLLAAMPALGIHSHNLTRDTCAALAVMLLLAAARRLATTGEAKWYDLTGAAAGLCVGFQYFAAPLWLLIPLAAFLSRGKADGSGKRVAAGLGVSLVVMVAVVFLACPYHFLHLGRFLADFRSETTHVGGGLAARLASPGWATHVFRMMPALLTWPMMAAVCLGLVAALARRREDDCLLLACFAIWAGIVGFDGRTYSRYYVPLLSVMALLASRGLLALASLVKPRGARVAALAVAIGAVAVPAGAMSGAWAWLYSRENTRTLAGEWIADHVGEGASIGVTKWPWQFEMPPLDPQRHRLVVMEDSPEANPEDVARLWQAKPDYFVTSSLQSGTIEAPSPAASDGAAFWRVLFHSPQLYRVCYRGEAPLSLLGWRVDLSGYPEDMRYVNPVIVVLGRTLAEASAGRGGWTNEPWDHRAADRLRDD